jgi:hypothetical protein
MADAVEAVIEEAEPESREAMRSGLALCFNKPPPASLGADPAGGLRDAVAAQVALLREMQAADGTGRMFFDSVPVEEEWLTAELTNAFEAALREGVAATGPAELVQALDAQWIRASLSELRDLLRRLVPPAESSLARCLIGVIPAAADCFQAREVAIRLEVAAGSSEAVVLCHVLAGMGGVGKTQLAAAYARRAWDTGQVAALVWVTASAPQRIVDAYARAAQRVARGIDTADPATAARRFMEWMAETSKPWLVVLDDVQRPGDVAGWWPPDRPAGRVVVTTRHRSGAWQERRRVQVDVDLFTPEEARAYLYAKFAGGDYGQSDVEIDALVDDLGRLPLALAQAAAFIINEDIDIPVYRRLLDERLLAHAVPEDPDLPDDQRQIVAAIWNLSVDQADRARPAGLARPLLYLASVLDPNGIPEIVLTSQPAREYLASYLSEPTGFEPVTEEEAVQALRILHRFNLIDHNRHATYQEVRIHQLIQRATRECEFLRVDQDLSAALADTAADSLRAVWPMIERDRLGSILRTNTSALESATGNALWAWHDSVPLVLQVSAMSLGATGQVTEAIRGYSRLCATATEILGPDHSQTLATHANLAYWRGEAGDLAGAEVDIQELLAACGEPHYDIVFAALANLARIRGEAGYEKAAVVAFERLVPASISLWGHYHPTTLTTQAAFAYWRGKAGDPAGAAAAFGKLLAPYKWVFGVEHPSTFRIRNHLALSLLEAGDPAAAVAAFEELLVDCLRLLGPVYPQTLIVRGNLLKSRIAKGDRVGVVSAGEELVADCRQVLGADHPVTLNVSDHQASLLAEAGDPAGAADALEELLADSARALGQDDLRTLTIRNNLVLWRALTGETAETVGSFEELLADCERVLGSDHPHTLDVRTNLTAFRGQPKITRWRSGGREGHRVIVTGSVDGEIG